MGRLRRVRNSTGFILATVFFLLVVLIFLDASLFQLIPTELNYATRLRQDTEAYYAATAGIKHCLAWMQAVTASGNPTGAGFSHQPFQVGSGQPYYLTTIPDPSAAPFNLRPSSPVVTPSPTDDTYYPANLPALTLDSTQLRLDNDWTANVTVFPDKYTSPHPNVQGNPLVTGRPPCYIIVAVAFQDFNHDGKLTPSAGEQFVVRAQCSVVQGTFARYAYFVDQWLRDPAPSGPYPYEQLPAGQSAPIFGGPVHTNGVPFLSVPAGTAYWAENTATAAPSFGSDLTIAGNLSQVGVTSMTYDGIAWVGGNVQDGTFNTLSSNYLPFSQSGATATAVPGRYERAFAKGQAAVKFVDTIELPSDSASVCLAAFGATDPSGVTGVPPDDVFVPFNANGQPKGGVVISGGTKTCLLDVLDSQGVSHASNAYNAPTPTSGAGAVKVVHDNQIIYISGTQTVNEVSYTPGSTTVTGAYTITSASGPGSPVTVVNQVQTGSLSTTIQIPTQGNVQVNPNLGGPVIQLQNGSTSQVQTVPLYGSVTSTYYVVNGMGPATIPALIPSTQLVTQILYGTYNPTDVIVEADGQPVNFSNSYLASGSAPPYFLLGTGTAYTSVPVASNGVLVAHQSRGGPQVYDRWQVLTGTLNGCFEVQGDLGGLDGWNKGPKTFDAEVRQFSSSAATATSSATPHNITIVGPLRQFGLDQSNLPTSGDNELGLIGGNVLVDVPGTVVATSASDPPSMFYYPSRPLYLYCALMAISGRFETLFPPQGQIGNGLGQLDVIGSVVQQQIGGLTDGVRGWSSAYQYDPYLTVAPPPGYPIDPTYILYHYQVDDLQ